MLSHEDAVLIALAAMLSLSVTMTAILHAGLRGVLTDYCRNPPLVRFWAAFADVFLVLLPLTVVVVSIPTYPTSSLSGWLGVVELLKYGLVAQVASLVCVASGVAMFGRGGSVPVWVEGEHADDLHRLVSRVQLLRARELVQQADEED
jgi:hypothetical protein